MHLTPDSRGRTGLGSVPRSSTLVHDTSRSTGPRMTAPSPKHDDRYSIGLRSHLFGVVSGQLPGACHQLKGTALTVGQRASFTVNPNRCPANCNSWTTLKKGSRRRAIRATSQHQRTDQPGRALSTPDVSDPPALQFPIPVLYLIIICTLR